MTRYSNTRLTQFENCPYAYDLKYNKKIETPYNTIEAFMGSRVHEALEKLYTDLQNDRMDSLEEILAYYDDRWFQEFDPGTIINNSKYSDDEQMEIGEQCIIRYYERMKPFDQISIAGLETDDELQLPDGNTYSVRIDKFGFKDGVFYVCDYKTSSWMKSQYEADNDRQLQMYALWVKRRYGLTKKVKMVWHMLKFDEDVESERSLPILEACEQEVVREIAEIESCTNWEPRQSNLCGWCTYRHMCPCFVKEPENGDEGDPDYVMDI